jgi:hypothetical protein
MVMMTMGNGNGIDLLTFDQMIKGQSFATFALWMNSGIQEQAVAIDFDKPSGSTNGGVGIEIGNPHAA